VLEIAEKHGLVVFVHCGALSVGFRKKLGLPSPFDMRYSNPLELHSIALRFASVRFIVPHFGAGLFREALMLADLCQNVFLDTSSSNRWRLYEGLDLQDVFARSLDLLGASRLVFGTDSSFFPRGWQQDVFDRQVEVLDRLGVGPEAAAKVFGGNLQELMRSAKAAA
jgi:predicted TIM-barrel fold metal-dependent hydrolase